ncbi:MAG: GNAT family N-acetyltransferase [Candidatus Cloacimonetes bacterium]|nr:GNAT family N-acetyltransferase [Candidatus Cloacimonadota bacterium]
MNKYRVYLRALEIEDYKITFKWRTDSEIQYGFSEKRVFVSSENEKKWMETIINDFNKVSLGICLKETDELIGLTFLTEIDMFNRTGHCPSFIGEKKYWGLGLATEARMLILHHAFFDRGLNRVWARIITDNIPSIRMCEKCGYIKEGLFRKSRFKNGQLVDEYYYAVLKEDFEKIWYQQNDF